MGPSRQVFTRASKNCSDTTLRVSTMLSALLRVVLTARNPSHSNFPGLSVVLNLNHSTRLIGCSRFSKPSHTLICLSMKDACVRKHLNTFGTERLRRRTRNVQSEGSMASESSRGRDVRASRTVHCAAHVRSFFISSPTHESVPASFSELRPSSVQSGY